MGLDRGYVESSMFDFLSSNENILIFPVNGRRAANSKASTIRNAIRRNDELRGKLAVKQNDSFVFVYRSCDSPKDLLRDNFESKCPDETWANVSGFPNYRISSFGRVASWSKLNGTEPCLRKIIFNDLGYGLVCLYGPSGYKTFLLHRLVAEHFVDGYFDGAVVDHIDGNPLNNRADNLRWVTQKENIYDSYKRGKQRRSPKAVLQYDLDGNLLRRFDSVADVKREFGYSHISEVCRGVPRYDRHYAKGYIWRYESDVLRDSGNERV